MFLQSNLSVAIPAADRKRDWPDSAATLGKLRQFIEHFGHSTPPPESSRRSCSANGDKFHPHEVARFWKLFGEQIPAQRDSLWTNLERGLTKYLQVII